MDGPDRRDNRGSRCVQRHSCVGLFLERNARKKFRRGFVGEFARMAEVSVRSRTRIFYGPALRRRTCSLDKFVTTQEEERKTRTNEEEGKKEEKEKLAPAG